MLIEIKSWIDGKIIHSIEADNVRDAVIKLILSGANLSRANLSGADLSGANLSGADLSGANLYGEKITKIPIQISGLKWWINITEKHIQIGCQVHKAEEWFKFKDAEIEKMHSEALVWWKENKKFIKSAWLHHCKEK